MEHLYWQGDTCYYRRRIPKDVRDHYAKEGKYRSGYIQRTLGTGDPKKISAAWSQVNAEIESEWDRLRAHLERAKQPQVLDQIDENIAKALIWKCWLAWQALGFESEHDVNEFGQWTQGVLEQLPVNIEMMPPRAVKVWHDTLDNQPQLRILTPFARNAVSRELPGMLPVVSAMPILNLEANPAFGIPKRKPKMLGEVMEHWVSHSRREGLKTRKDKDGNSYKVADKNYQVPFRIARDVFGENTFISHIGRDEVIDLVEILRYLPKGAHKLHEKEGLAYREIATQTRLAIEDGEDVALNTLSTVNKYLGAITTLFNHAQANTWITEHPALQIRIPSREQSRRRALEPDELAKLFHSEYVPRTNTWIPLLLLYHGARTNEIAQLDVADVIQRPGGLWCLSLAEDGLDQGKSLKTEASRRIIPIHHRVRELGFLDFVERRRSHGAHKLFNVGRGAVSFWETVRDDVTALFKATGVYKEGEVVPYSIRHTWTHAARAIDLPDAVQDAIGGWSQGGSAKAGYGRKRNGKVIRYEPETLVDYVNQISFPGLFMAAAPAGWSMEDYERPEAVESAA